MLLAFLFIFFSIATQAQISVTATLGTPGPTAYTSLNAAITAINAGTHMGVINISVTANCTETALATLNESGSGASSYTSITIKPAAATNPVITGNFATGVLFILGSNVTIDGSNTAGGTTQNLTIRNTNTASDYVIRIGSPSAALGATGNTIKNCILTNGSATGTGSVILAGSGTTVYAQAEAPNSNTTIANNTLSGAQIGVDDIGATALDNNVTITGNTITNVTFIGIQLFYASNLDISSNNISGISINAGAGVQGILLSWVITNANIYKNKISDITCTYYLSTPGAEGIYMDLDVASSNVNVYNNFIADVKAASASAIGDNGIGIYIDGGAGFNIYDNSVSQGTAANPTVVGTATLAGALTAAVAVDPYAAGAISTGSIKLIDNIMVNTETVSTRYSLYCTGANTLFNTIDYNDYYSTPNLGNIGGVNRTSIAQMQAGFGGNVNSITVNPTFISATDLHLQNIPANYPLIAGTPTLTPAVLTDIDGTTRSTSVTTIGAHELNSNNITYTALGNTCSTGDITLSGVSITSALGVPTTGATMPRIYFRKNAGTWFSAAGTLTSGTATSGTWSFTIPAATMGGFTGGDVVSYYVIAQNVSGTVFANPSAGLVATNVNTVTTPPATPNTYNVNAVVLAGLTTSQSVCYNASSAQTVSYAYTGTAGTPNQYTLTWSPAGPANVSSFATFPASPITVTVPAATAANTYTGSLTVQNSTTGCSTTASLALTVNPMPAAITGTTITCIAQTTTLACTPASGTWSSSAPGTASVGISNGVVTGAAVGTATITYTAPGGCTATTVVTVHTPPSAISGPATICGTGTAALGNTTPGGVWAAVPTTVATVSPTGTLTSVTTTGGISSVSYSITGCPTATTSVTVYPLAPVVGPAGVCVGYTVTETDATPGGSWVSSNPSIASVGTSSGVVTGLAIGTATISYVLSSGCAATQVVSVNVIGPITGSLNVCVGLTTTLNNIAGGGTWSIAPTAVAAVNTTSGVVTGVAAGVATVTYTLSSGCTVTNTLIVYGLPNAITGPTQVCQGQTITVGDSSPGGIWSSSTPSIAAISSGGVISGGGVAGTAVISYTLPTTCYSTRVVTVNPLPADISGSNYVCLGSATVLTDASTPGTWSSSSPSIAPVGPTTGNVIGNTAGLATITYTLPTGCYKLFLMHVSTPPSAAPAGGAALCEASSTVLTNAVPGGTWSSASPFIASVGTAGIVTGVVTGLTTISYTIPGCTPALYTVSVNPIPAPITGVSSVCVAHTTTLADASGGGVWSVSGASASISPIGVVTGLAYGATSVVSYTFPATGCRRTVNIMVDSLPSPIVGTDSVCKGSSVTLTDPSPFGIWSSSDGTIASAIAATGEVIGVLSGNVHISYTLISGCYVETPFKVIEPLVASVTLTDTPVANPLCEGTPITLTAHAVNGGVAPIFIWQRFGADIHTDTGINTYTFLPEHGDFMRVYMVAQGICAAPVPATDSLVMTVYPHAAPIVSIHTDFNPLASTPPNSCASVTGIFETASITGDTITLHWNAATGTTGYEWVAGKSPNIMPSSGNYTNTTSVIVTTTGYPDGMQRYYLVRNKCSTGNSDWASDPLLIPYWGQMVTFTSDVTYGGTGAQYQWLKNGAPIPGATNHTYAQPMYYNDTFSLQVTSDAPCNTATIGASNRIIVMASQLAVPAAGALHELSLYPNPNKGIFTVSGNVNADVKEVTLEVNDILGREVYRGATQVHNGSLHGQVQLSKELPNGSYMLRAHAGAETQVFYFVIGD